MKKLWGDRGWDDYVWWQENDRKMLKKINKLIKDIERHWDTGLGKPEPLKDFNSYWSRRITDEHRLVYKVKEGILYIAQCKGHYDD